jgi:hypothetical protein
VVQLTTRITRKKAGTNLAMELCDGAIINSKSPQSEMNLRSQCWRNSVLGGTVNK